MNNNSGSPPYITLATNSYTYIDLSYNKFTGPISFLTNLVYFLDISYNQFSGVIPPLLGKMKRLEILNLSHKNLTRGVLPTLANCGSLNVLDLKANHLSSNIPWSSIHGNEFSGSLPSWIGVTLSNLQILQLRLNMFTRTIPELWNLGYLEVVDVSHNRLTGAIPRDLSNNNLSGTILEEVTDLIGLIVLNLSRNRFFGKLPQSIGRLQQSINLDLSRNRLFGLILAAIASLTFLSYLNLSYNNLSRIIPSSNQVDTSMINRFMWLASYKYYSSSNRRELSNPKVTLLPMEPKGRRNTKQSKDTTPKRTYGDIPWKKDRVEIMIRPTHSHWYTAFF
ncbi:receptor-like protein EIX1 [Aristolochia californica]|uniref:receptor-like protein EIX1 n=1 Tax=Aristolochia californica TaxID=171875 RepID=UPI0035DBDD0E